MWRGKSHLTKPKEEANIISSLISLRRLHPAMVCKHFFSRASSDNESERKVFGRSSFKLSMKAKSALSILIIAIMLVSVFAFLPRANQSPNTTTPQSSDSPVASNQTKASGSGGLSQISDVITIIGSGVAQALAPPKGPGTIESAQGNMTSSVWRQVAANAWNFFQPGWGVDPNTGLLRSGGTDSPVFTDWDLGVYIQAVMDANASGLISNNGSWGSSARLEKVVSFLETRPLNATTGYPFWFYQAADGQDYHADSDLATSPVDVADTGRLFVALSNLEAFNSSLILRINNIVLYGQNFNRSNYAALVPGIKAESQSSTSIYAYYIASGFESFWPNQLFNATNNILNNMHSAGNVTTPEGVSLPLAAILGDPLYCSVFETSGNVQLMALAHQVYLAHEAYYNAALQATGTGQYRAFSEGGSLSYSWTYEWVVLPDNRTWAVLDSKNQPFDISPIIYTKIAISFLALYNTTFAYNMVVYLESTLPTPVHGYSEGVDESEAQLTGTGSNTNGLIIGAARYAIQNNP